MPLLARLFMKVLRCQTISFHPIGLLVLVLVILRKFSPAPPLYACLVPKWSIKFTSVSNPKGVMKWYLFLKETSVHAQCTQTTTQKLHTEERHRNEIERRLELGRCSKKNWQQDRPAIKFWSPLSSGPALENQVWTFQIVSPKVTRLSFALSKHLKGQLGTPVNHLTFFRPKEVSWDPLWGLRLSVHLFITFKDESIQRKNCFIISLSKDPNPKEWQLPPPSQMWTYSSIL